MTSEVSRLVAEARDRMAASQRPNPFVDRLETGEIPRERLRALAGELHRLVDSDRRSFALLGSRFPAGAGGDLFLAMAQGEATALLLLDGFAVATGMSELDLRSYEPRPLAQAYPAYLTRTAVHGTRSDVALALLANAPGSGALYARVADALTSRYGFDDKAVGHFRFFADTPRELLDLAEQTLRDGLAAGDDPADAVRTATTVHALETAFWQTMAEGTEQPSAPLDRTRRLLDRARYVNLATVSPEGEPWVATLEYAWFAGPLRLVFGSATGSRHSLDVAANASVSGALFTAPAGPGLDVAATDGAQFTGTCVEISPDDLPGYHAGFYRAVFPDPRQRAEYQLEPARLAAPAAHRLYLVTVDRWWLIDTSTWETDRIDRRTEVPRDDLDRLPVRP
ncbi:pyridoxamine 5'-phosphate oxidase family protein [Actinoplanes sp. NPDC049802]|uniref:pyridoxamine 5'-phosphate oxidase family protein n=1 Tax=Actinoplanes sp. NPDC049802 TaxID=3154742 RepID=UPI0033DFB873